MGSLNGSGPPFILFEQTICERMKISITELLNIPPVLPLCLAKAEVALGGTTFKWSMGIFAWCNVSYATSWSDEGRLDAPQRKPPTQAWQHT